ncbi:MAG: hypothetical protein HZB51_00830 [Chloroflexi bacterium]|nr:hypothetical protein [Chloroflexota bacterium]
MPKPRKMWVYSPTKPSAPKVPERVEMEAQTKANQLIETVLKPKHIQPPPKGYDFNYIVDLDSKWYRHYFYFCAKYCSPGPNALSPFFETKFSCMEFVGPNRFHLSFMRHTGEWIELYPNSSLEECLTIIQSDPLFPP